MVVVVVPRIDPKSVVVKVAYKRILVFCYGPFWSDDKTEFFFVQTDDDEKISVIQKK